MGRTGTHAKIVAQFSLEGAGRRQQQRCTCENGSSQSIDDSSTVKTSVNRQQTGEGFAILWRFAWKGREEGGAGGQEAEGGAHPPTYSKTFPCLIQTGDGFAIHWRFGWRRVGEEGGNGGRGQGGRQHGHGKILEEFARQPAFVQPQLASKGLCGFPCFF